MRREEGATELRQRGSTDEMVMGGDDYGFRYPLQRELECETIHD